MNYMSRPARALWIEMHLEIFQEAVETVEAREGLVD